ncbi:MAG: YihY/virulence factor BrkB family protein [Agathobacter sp.]|nr:YihY/virulence factor BrkB family protein [Agathobacter sp.]
MRSKKVYVYKYLLDFYNKYKNSAISAYSGQGAFFLMLSFFPFMLFFLSVLELTPLTERDFLEWMSIIIPKDFNALMTGFVKEIYSGNPGSRISITMITAVFLSSKSFVAIQQGLNSMYGIKETRNMLILRIQAIFYSIVFALVLIIILGIFVFGNKIGSSISAYFPLLDSIIEGILEYRILVGAPLLFLFLWTLYSFLPDWRHSGQRRQFRNQINGAVFTTASWIIFSHLFSIYVNHSSYSSFYGTMTTIAFIMVWLYWCMYVLFIGGIINR